MENRFKLPRVKPGKSQITTEYLYHQQQVLATMQNFVRMCILSVAELDHKFIDAENNKRFQRVLDDLYFIENRIQKNPKFIFRPHDTDLAFDVSGETYELNKILSYLDISGIKAITESIKAAIQKDKN